MKTLKSELTTIMNFIPNDSYCLYSNELKELSLRYEEEEVAKECYKLDRNDATLLYLLAIAGNKKSEKYLRLSLENNEDGDGSTIRIALGFIALNIEEGFQIIEQLLNKTYPTKFNEFLEDVYAYLLHVIHISPRALKMLEDIENGKYGDASFIISYVEEKKRRLNEK